MPPLLERKLLKFFGLRPTRTRRKKSVPRLMREEARDLVHARLEHFNQFYGFSYNKVFIKNQRTRWGSCSSIGNLNFNYRILLLPPELRDYLIVHELCHLKQMNHGKQFWELVALQVPEYRSLRVRLRRRPMEHL